MSDQPLTTATEVADLLLSRLDEKYDLIYIDRGDRLTDEQVAHLVAGDFEKLWESIDEWESDARWYGVKQEIEELVERLKREYDEDETALEAILEFDSGGEEWDQVRWEIEERDTGSWFNDLVRATPNVLLRINCLDEDHAFAFREVTPVEVLEALGIDATSDNVQVVANTLLECSPEYSVLLGYWIVGADVGEINEVHKSGAKQVEITNPYLYLGNPFAGSGWISEKPLICTVTVATEDLRTDKAAFGYSVDDVYGGLSASSFEATITPVPLPEEASA